MHPAHPRERRLGMRYYVSETPGIGGRLKASPADFRVTESAGVDLEPVDADPGEYPYLVLEVELTDWDTHRFVDALSRATDTHPEAIAWAGTKDATAVTRQRFSVRGLTPEEIPTFEGVDARAIGRFGRQLEFGDHAGNAFEIVVRGVDHPERAMAITDELRAWGGGDTVAVANYFGHQRFGTMRPVTHRVGAALLAGEYRQAVCTYLGGPHPDEPERTRRFRRFIDETATPTDAWERALERVPGYLDHERTMLEVLASASTPDADAFRAAIEALPWSLQRLFVHATQSLLFNEILSERLRRGIPFDRPVEGDVICLCDETGRIDPDRPQPVTADRLQTARRHCERGRAAVTAPLLGRDSDLADGEPGRIERAVFAHYGLDRRAFAGGPFAQSGTRRAIRLRTDLTIERDPMTFAFSLPPGAYATVLMREFLKTDPATLG